MIQPKITFVIPTRNHCSRVLKVLSLVRASIGRLSHEIIVVDKGSTDGTAEAIGQRFPQVRIIELDTDHDSGARNVGLAAAAAEQVFLLDDATWPDKGAAEYALRMMADRPRLAAATCRVRRMGEMAQGLAAGPAGVLASSAAVVRRAAAVEVGGYPIDADGLADSDLSARLWRAGWEICRFDSMVAWREAGGPALAKDGALLTVAANSLRFWRRYAPEARYEALVGEPVERCDVHRRPLSEEQLAGMVGADLPQATARDVSVSHAA